MIYVKPTQEQTKYITTVLFNSLIQHTLTIFYLVS